MPDPNNCLVHEHKICFQFICKAGNTSVKRALVDLLCKEHEKEHVFKRPHSKWKYCNKYEIPNDYLVIGFCRNPEDRLISCWRDKVQGKEPFPSFLRQNIPHRLSFDNFVKRIYNRSTKGCDQHFRLQTYDLNLDRVDAIIKMETFDDDWEKVRKLIYKHCGINYPKIKPQNVSKKAPVEISYETRRMIENKYLLDYETFGYELKCRWE